MKTALVTIIIILGIAIAGYFFMNRKSSFSLDPTPTPSISASTLPAPKDMYAVTIKTDRGDITLELYRTKAPKTVGNFITLAHEGFYNGMRFHRVIDDFMIQGGDPFSKDIATCPDGTTGASKTCLGRGGPGYEFEDEINDMKVLPGVIAMANAGPGTNGSQFFIVTTKPQPHLDGKHTVFGKVINGMDVVLSIRQGDLISSVVVQ